jgi:hypothetical protein
MEGPLLDFFRAARSAGLRISPAETIEAARAAGVVGYADRQRLRDTLGLVLAKTVEEKRAYGECFDLFFTRGSFGDTAAKPAAPLTQDAAPSEGEGGGELARALLANDQAALAAAVEAAAREARLSEISLFTQVNLFTRRIMERMGLGALEREIGRTQDADRKERLRAARDALLEQVRGFVEQNLLLFAEGRNQEVRERMLQQARLTAIDRRDHERMRVLVRAMAHRLATLYGRPRKRDRRGVLDVRRTLRRNMGWDAIPFRTIWKQEKIEKPRLVVLCDVSGSVAAVAQFLLLFLYSLNEALAGLRAFAFSSALADVSDLLEDLPIERAIPEVMARIGMGSSNYGQSLADFEREHMDLLDSHTTVIILGDGRGNRTDPRAEILQRMANRAKQVVWLNPEVRTIWGTGDSDMPKYLPHCRLAVTCNSLAQLERVIGELLRVG